MKMMIVPRSFSSNIPHSTLGCVWTTHPYELQELKSLNIVVNVVGTKMKEERKEAVYSMLWILLLKYIMRVNFYYRDSTHLPS
jgi:hypothetical protein